MRTGRKLLVSFTREMAAHVKGGRHREALRLLAEMRASPEIPAVDAFVYPLALNCCAALRLPGGAAALHAHAAKAGLLPGNSFVSSALIDAYAKSFSPTLSPAQNLFDEIPQRNAIVWGAIIAAHARAGDYSAAAQLLDRMDVPPLASAFNSIIAAAGGAGCAATAFGLLRRMQAQGIRPTLVTALALLPICAAAAALHLVKELHAYALRHHLLPDARLSSAAVEAYGRCGSAAYAGRVFRQVGAGAARDVVTWSALVSAYAFNGDSAGAMAAFRRMAAEGVSPDGIMFLAVMKACSHAGKPEEARRYMKMMTEYAMEPGGDHYACLVDAMARAGRLGEAHRIADQMPRRGSTKAWGALLGACRVHGDVSTAEAAAAALAEIEPENAANWVILSSIYAAAGMHEAAERARREIKARRLRRVPGSSWVNRLTKASVDHDFSAS